MPSLASFFNLDFFFLYSFSFLLDGECFDLDRSIKAVNNAIELEPPTIPNNIDNEFFSSHMIISSSAHGLN